MEKNAKTILIYGVEQDRANLFKKYESYLNKFIDRDTPIEIDNYNNEIINSLGKCDWSLDSEIDTRYLFNQVQERSEDWDKEIRQKARKWPLWDAYIKKTKEVERFKFSNFSKKILPTIQTSAGIKKETNLSEKMGNIIIKKGCKLGLELTSSMDNLNILFVLDNLDIESIVKKTNYKECLTGSEL